MKGKQCFMSVQIATINLHRTLELAMSYFYDRGSSYCRCLLLTINFLDSLILHCPQPQCSIFWCEIASRHSFYSLASVLKIVTSCWKILLEINYLLNCILRISDSLCINVALWKLAQLFSIFYTDYYVSNAECNTRYRITNIALWKIEELF
jgi:hypothetical protein